MDTPTVGQVLQSYRAAGGPGSMADAHLIGLLGGPDADEQAEMPADDVKVLLDELKALTRADKAVESTLDGWEYDGLPLDEPTGRIFQVPREADGDSYAVLRYQVGVLLDKPVKEVNAMLWPDFMALSAHVILRYGV